MLALYYIQAGILPDASNILDVDAKTALSILKIKANWDAESGGGRRPVTPQAGRTPNVPQNAQTPQARAHKMYRR